MIGNRAILWRSRLQRWCRIRRNGHIHLRSQIKVAWINLYWVQILQAHNVNYGLKKLQLLKLKSIVDKRVGRQVTEVCCSSCEKVRESCECVEIRPRLVSDRINAICKKLLSEMSVPVVLDLVIGPSWQLSSNLRPPSVRSRKQKISC